MRVTRGDGVGKVGHRQFAFVHADVVDGIAELAQQAGERPENAGTAHGDDDTGIGPSQIATDEQGHRQGVGQDGDTDQLWLTFEQRPAHIGEPDLVIEPETTCPGEEFVVDYLDVVARCPERSRHAEQPERKKERRVGRTVYRRSDEYDTTLTRRSIPF